MGGRLGQERLDRRPDPLDNRAEIGRLSRPRLAQHFQRRRDRPALGVAQHHRQARPETLGRELDAAHL